MTASVIDFFRLMKEGKLVFDICDVSDEKGFLLSRTDIKPKKSASPSVNVFTAIALTALGNKTLPISLKIFKDDLGDKDILGLKYEMKIYRRIIENIILKNQSPNFVAYVASGCCREKTGTYSRLAQELYLNNYCILATERVGNGAYFGFAGEYPVETLHDIFRKLEEKDRLGIMVQLCYSLELVQRYRIVHNDLHAGNVLVMALPEKIDMGFDIDGKKYKISTRYIPYIFDWDFGYCEIFGPNPKLEREKYYQYDITNKFNKKKDLYTLLCTLRYGISRFMDLVEEKDERISIKISPETAEKIVKYRPLFKNTKGKSVFRLGRKQIEEFFGPDYAALKYGYFTLSKKGEEYYAKFYSGFTCRLSAMEESLESPIDHLRRTCSDFEVKDLDDIKERFVYTMPSEEKIRSIFIDPLLARRGRETLQQLGIKPRFPPQKSGYVKTKDFKDLVVDYDIPLEIIQERLKNVKDNYEY